MDKIDVMNAAHLIADYCDSQDGCYKCCFYEDWEGCKLSGRDPLEWEIYGDEDQEEKKV